MLTANGLMQRSNDTAFAFRQDSNFWYLTGIEQPDIVLVIDESEEYLIVPGRSGSRQVFDGAIDNTDLSRVSGIKQIYPADQGWEKLTARLKKSKVGIIEPPKGYLDMIGLYANPARARLRRQLRTAHSAIELLDIRSQLVNLRMVKQQAEVNAIKEAIDLTATGLSKISRHLNDYGYEYDIEADLTATFIRHQAGHAYEPIVAGGQNACTLHYVQNSSPLAVGQLILIDVGAEIHNYAADITRTFSIGPPTVRQQQVFDAVSGLQQFAYQQLRPGVLIREYEQLVEKQMGKILKELGLITSTNRADIRHYYPHSTSHFLGLDVHDAADYHKPLAPGMALTVEPGIYIPEEGIGIRIEDDVIITKTGLEILSIDLPSGLNLDYTDK